MRSPGPSPRCCETLPQRPSRPTGLRARAVRGAGVRGEQAVARERARPGRGPPQRPCLNCQHGCYDSDESSIVVRTLRSSSVHISACQTPHLSAVQERKFPRSPPPLLPPLPVLPSVPSVPSASSASLASRFNGPATCCLPVSFLPLRLRAFFHECALAASVPSNHDELHRCRLSCKKESLPLLRPEPLL